MRTYTFLEWMEARGKVILRPEQKRPWRKNKEQEKKARRPAKSQGLAPGQRWVLPFSTTAGGRSRHWQVRDIVDAEGGKRIVMHRWGKEIVIPMDVFDEIFRPIRPRDVWVEKEHPEEYVLISDVSYAKSVVVYAREGDIREMELREFLELFEEQTRFHLKNRGRDATSQHLDEEREKEKEKIVVLEAVAAEWRERILRLESIRKARGHGNMHLARFRSWQRGGNFGEVPPLDWGHPAIYEERTVYPSTIIAPEDTERLLISGQSNSKLGSKVLKGRFKGFPIYTLTLHERATCPFTCHHYRTCYGNDLHLSKRIHPWEQTKKPNGKGWVNEGNTNVFEMLLYAELRQLQEEHPGGFVVRLHQLGDFYSVEYVKLWEWWLREFPALHVFGYTARLPESDDDPIGKEVDRVRREQWDRFAIRISRKYPREGKMEAISFTGEMPLERKRIKGAIICPAQQLLTETCGTCALCWEAPGENIAFGTHGRMVGKEKRKAQGPERVSVRELVGDDWGGL